MEAFGGKNFWHLECPVGVANFTPPSHLSLHIPKIRRLDEEVSERPAGRMALTLAPTSSCRPWQDSEQRDPQGKPESQEQKEASIPVLSCSLRSIPGGERLSEKGGWE